MMKLPQAPYEPTSEEREDLAILRQLVRAGVPVVIGVPHPRSPGDYKPPPGWQKAQPNEAVLDRWRPGLALGVVTGVVVDVLDVDPRNGGSESLGQLRQLDAVPDPLAVVSTASEGVHYWFSTLQVGKKSRGGVDLLSGLPDGSSRAIAWVPPTRKASKVDGHVRAYRWVHDPDLSDAALHLNVADPRRALLTGWFTENSSPRDSRKKPPSGGPGSKGQLPTAYGQRVWNSEIERLRQAPEGERNNTLNRVSFKISQIFHGGELGADPQPFLDELRRVAADLDLSYAIEPTLESGWNKGADDPRDNSSYSKPAGDQPANDDGDVSWDPERSGMPEALAGQVKPTEPTVLQRSDGHFLFYPGKVHSLHGESESGKSFVAQYAAAEQIGLGNKVVYVDYESDAPTLVERLTAMGVSRQQLSQLFLYVRPEHPPGGRYFEELIVKAASEPGATLVVVDGVTEALVISNTKTNDNDEVTAWFRNLPRRLAGCGAAVVVVDHVIKSNENRGRFALGAQGKMSALDGAAYTVNVLEPMGVGLLGRLELRVAKDRPGRVRPWCGQWDEFRTQQAAVVYFDSRALGGPGGQSKTANQLRVLVDAPVDAAETDKSGQEAKNEQLAAAVIDYLAHWPRSTKGEIERGVPGDNNKIRKVLQRLMDQGYVQRTETGSSRAIRCELNPERPWGD